MVAPERARTSVLSRRLSKVFKDRVNQGRMAALAMPIVPLEGGETVIVGVKAIGSSFDFA